MGGPGSGSHRKCAICGVNERRCDKKLFYARFPSNKDRCKAWVRATGNEELAYVPVEKLHTRFSVCEQHFSKRDFNKCGNRLKKRVVPHLHLTAEPLSEEILKEFPLPIARGTVGKFYFI